MEKSINVFLNTVTDVKEFCYAASEFPRKVTVKAHHGEFIVNAKSLLGMISLNLSEPIKITFTSEDDTLNENEIYNKFTKWVIE